MEHETAAQEALAPVGARCEREAPRLKCGRYADITMSAIESVMAAGQELPQSILDRSGEILDSSAQTLRQDPIYLLGLNPGGNPDDHTATVRDRLRDLSF